MRKAVVTILILFGFAQISQGEPTSGIRYLLTATATPKDDQSRKDLKEEPVTLMDFGITRLKDELLSGRVCPTIIDSIRPSVIIYYEKGLNKLKINLSYVLKSFRSSEKERERVKSEIISFILGLKSLCFAINLKTGQPINGVQSDLIKYLALPDTHIPENLGPELDKITELEVDVSTSGKTTVRCVSALLGKEMSFID